MKIQEIVIICWFFWTYSFYGKKDCDSQTVISSKNFIKNTIGFGLIFVSKDCLRLSKYKATTSLNITKTQTNSLFCFWMVFYLILKKCNGIIIIYLLFFKTKLKCVLISFFCLKCYISRIIVSKYIFEFNICVCICMYNIKII